MSYHEPNAKIRWAKAQTNMENPYLAAGKLTVVKTMAQPNLNHDRLSEDLHQSPDTWCCRNLLSEPAVEL